jgi:bifunctional non-homologous end joining protein LigD
VVKKPLRRLEERAPRGGVAPSARTRSSQSAADLPGAVKANLPATLAPQLATLATSVPASGEWSYEIKFDGYRLLARIEQGRARLFTRNGNDWTAKLKALAAAVETLGVQAAWLDGEIVVLNQEGTPDFNALQNAFDASRTDSIDYFLFDLLYLTGHDLRHVPLHARRALLKQLVEAKGIERVRFSGDFTGDPGSILASACGLGLEGIIAKRVDAPYVSARAPTWLKLKGNARQEFVIGGFTDRVGSAVEVGGLLLGYHDPDGKLQYAGNVGTGWNAATGAALRKRLAKIEVARSPFAPGTVKSGRWSKRAAGAEHWVKPKLVAEVSFAEWTPDGRVRQPVFQGLRSDKAASAITRETATEASRAAAPSSANRAGTVKVSHPERIIDPSTGLKKLNLVRYYESIGEWMLPHLKGRPVSLVRGPRGISGQLFFQKHDDKLSIPGLRELDPALSPGHAALLEVPTAEALVSAAQLNVIEFHTWNSTIRNIDKPDRMVFDLDPGAGVVWTHVQEAALLTRALLTELGLASWLKTSGGKGLHIVVPLAPRLSYDAVKDFSQAIVQHLAKNISARFVAKSGSANRVGRIFVDYLRNGHGATTAAAFSARARPGLGVSMPVAWEQLATLKWTISTAREHLSFQKTDPWAGYWTSGQTLTAAMKVLGFKARPAKR